MKILNVDPKCYSEDAISLLKTVGMYKSIEFLSREEFLENIVDIDVLVIRFSFKLDKEFFSKAKKLKAIICNVTGPNHIDEYCLENNKVKLYCLRGYTSFLSNIYSTAELTWMFVMMSQRNIIGAIESVKNNQWDRDLFVGKELFGKSIGVIGVGRIGKKIVDYSNAFGLVVHYYDIRDVILAGAQKHNSLESIFSEGLNIYTIHLPLNELTAGIIDEKVISKIKCNAALINTSRGELIDELSLIERLKEGDISYYTDVISDEHNLKFSHGLLLENKNLSNLYITPHIGGAAYEAWWKTEVFCVKNFLADFSSKGKLECLNS